MTSERGEPGEAPGKADPPARIVTNLYNRLTDVLLGKRPAVPEDVREVRDLDPQMGRPFVSADRMIYRVMHALEGGKVRLEALNDAAAGLPPGHALSEAAAYLAFQSTVSRHLRDNKLDRLGAQELAAHADALLALLDEVATAHPAMGAHLVNRAKVESLRDRDAAARLLHEARTAAPEFVQALRYDFGTNTYLTAAEVAAPGPDYPGEVGRAGLRAALAETAPAFANAVANLVWSTDVRFFRIHGPPWFEVLPYLMRLGLRPICFMIGEAGEAEAAIAEARALIAATARFRGEADPESSARSVVFVRLDVPAFVAQPMTYYATARHLHARQVIEETGAPVVITDFDMTVKEPFAPFLAALAEAQVAVPFTRGLAALSPWRRYMAGTGWFTPTPQSLAFLETVERYIVRGLDRDPSWTLDQNALAFAVEGGAGGAVVDNLNLTGRRPAGQDELRKQFERTFQNNSQ